MLQFCQFFILNAAPMAMDAGMADPHFPKLTFEKILLDLLIDFHLNI